MDLRQLRYFVGIVQAGSLSRAAEHLHVAQSAISHHLASLEAEMAKPLVTRGPKGIALTEAGTILYRHAEAILRHVEFAKQDAMSALAVPSGHVAVGFPSALSAILAHELFARVRSAYPQVLLRLVDGNSGLLRELLDNGRLDFALLFAGQPERGLAVEPLLVEELFYVSADRATGPISLADAARRPLLLPGSRSGIQRVAQEAFKQRGLNMTLVGEVDIVYPLRKIVESGAADTILPLSALYGDHERALTHRRFEDATLNRPVSLCFSETAQRNPAFDAVAATLKVLILELIERGQWQGVSLVGAPAEASLSALPP
jgi:LysR family nitrogen assimilation transcriptional regulator